MLGFICAMQRYVLLVTILTLQSVVIGQISLPYSARHGVVGDLSWQENSSKSSSASQSANAPSTRSNTNYFVGNLSQPFSFEVAPSSSKVHHLGFNTYSLFIMGVGSPNDPRFKYDEHNNRLTIFSLDSNTVGFYSAVDANWNKFVNIISAVNVSSIEIRHFQVAEDDSSSSLVSCSVSIIRSTYSVAEPTLQSDNSGVKSSGVEFLPHLDLFLSTETSPSVVSNRKFYNDTVNIRDVMRTVTLQRRLTRADHNETIQCQLESSDKFQIYVVKTARIDIEYGPNLERGALPKVRLENEASKSVELQCQIEANPSPSYVWYKTARNISTMDSATDDEQRVSFDQLTSTDDNIFGTTRQITTTYEFPGNYMMLCQAQSRGRTVKQQFLINIRPRSNSMMPNLSESDDQQKTHNLLKLICLTVVGLLLLVIFAIGIAKIVTSQRRKADPNEENIGSTEKLPNDKSGKSRWGTLPIDYSKYKHESLKTDSSSTSHLVESAETNSIQGTTTRSRPSPIISTNSSYRQTPLTSVSLSYRQASALPGFRASTSARCYSPEREDVDEVDLDHQGIALAVNRSRTTTPFGSRKSLSESVQSLRSNQQTPVSLPVKKRSNDVPPMLPRREQKTPSPDLFQAKQDYQHHHYHNPAVLRAQQQLKIDKAPSEGDEDFEQHTTNPISEDSAATGSTAASFGYNQVEFHAERECQTIKSPVAKQTSTHQTPGAHRDEAPPPYHQIIKSSSPSQVYMYQEPTEV